jgi:serine phosphatase RsbU (regulator of sigma subunit)
MQSGTEHDVAVGGGEARRPRGERRAGRPLASLPGALWAWLRSALTPWEGAPAEQQGLPPGAADVAPQAEGWPYDPADPLVAELLRARGTVLLDAFAAPSPLAERMRASGAVLAVPLLNSGELVGILTAGAKRSDQRYSSGDRVLLDQLAGQVAPALHVAQLVLRQKEEAAEHGRLEQEMRLARDIQLALLPAALPQLPGWSTASRYTPARTVGGDFYDFIPRADGRLGVLIADVSGKGMAAALLMATTRSILRSVIDAEEKPGAALRRANTLLKREIPKGFFVTCLYGLLDPATGVFVFANAGHNLPVAQRGTAASLLRARGMPLGLMDDMAYEEQATTLEAGDLLLLYSDGLVEAHDAGRAMYGRARLSATLLAMQDEPSGCVLDAVLEDWQGFVGGQDEQEDDLTLIALRRTA